jgi:hypothetical protein
MFSNQKYIALFAVRPAFPYILLLGINIRRYALDASGHICRPNGKEEINRSQVRRQIRGVRHFWNTKKGL